MMLELWTVYRSPADYPGQFVARRFVVGGPMQHPLPNIYATTGVRVAATLEAVRDLLPPGLFCLKRMPGDEPHIVECWL